MLSAIIYFNSTARIEQWEREAALDAGNARCGLEEVEGG